MSGPLLLAAAACPLSIALALGPRRLRPSALAVAPWAGAPALGLALAGEDAALAFPGLVLGTELVLDGTTRIFLGVTAALWLASGIYGGAYLARDERRESYTAFFLTAMGGNLGLTVASDPASFYVFFSAMSFASYGLVVHSRDPAALRAGRVYLTLVIAGELLLFSGFVLLVPAAGFRSAASLSGLRAPAEGWAMPLLFAGFGIKAGALPLHVWLPLAHPVAPTPASAVLSGAMIKAGLIGWIRFLPVGAASETWVFAVAALGLAGAFYAAIVGVLQSDSKTVLAYSSVSQMGLITVAFAAALGSKEAGLPAVLAYTAHHAAAKCALFLGVGIAAAARSRTERAAAAAALVGLAAALSGLPGTSGAAAKLVLKSAGTGLAGAAPLLNLLPLAAVGTTLLMARFLLLVLPREGAHAAKGGAPALGLWLPWGALVAAVAAGPLWLPGWKSGFGKTLALDTALPAIWPVAVGASIAAFAIWVGRRSSRRLPQVPPGDLLALIETGWRTLRAGAGSLRERRFPKRLEKAGSVAAGAIPSKLAALEERLAAGPILGVLMLLVAAALAFTLVRSN